MKILWYFTEARRSVVILILNRVSTQKQFRCARIKKKKEEEENDAFDESVVVLRRFTFKLETERVTVNGFSLLMSTASTLASVLLISTVFRACMCGHVLLVCSHACIHLRRAGAARNEWQRESAARCVMNRWRNCVEPVRGENVSRLDVLKASPCKRASDAEYIFRANIFTPRDARNAYIRESIMRRVATDRDWKWLRYFTPTRVCCLSNYILKQQILILNWCKINCDPRLAAERMAFRKARHRICDFRRTLVVFFFPFSFSLSLSLSLSLFLFL